MNGQCWINALLEENKMVVMSFWPEFPLFDLIVHLQKQVPVLSIIFYMSIVVDFTGLITICH